MTVSVDRMGLDDGTEVARLMRRFYPLILEAAANDAADLLGLDAGDTLQGAFDQSNPRVQDVLDKLAHKVRGVAETTKDDIRMLVGRAADEGWSPGELAKQIREYGVTASKARSEAIARTETATAYTQGSLLAYQESGVVKGTQWLATDPCDICQPLEGQTVDLGELFGGEYEGPPAHPNCRCAVAPVLKQG